MARVKTTVYVDERLLRIAKVYGARKGIRDSDVFEQAIEKLVGLDVLDDVWARSDLSEDEAMALAVEAVHDSRKERQD